MEKLLLGLAKLTPFGQPLTSEEMADILWLMLQRQQHSDAAPDKQPDSPPPAAVETVILPEEPPPKPKQAFIATPPSRPAKR